MQELDDLLKASVQVDNAVGGFISAYDARWRVLRLVAVHGLPQAFVETASAVALHEHTACAQAARERRRIVIRDVRADAAFEPYLWVAEACGFRSVQATPVIGARRRFLGCISTMYARPHHPAPASLRALDGHAATAQRLLEAVIEGEFQVIT